MLAVLNKSFLQGDIDSNKEEKQMTENSSFFGSDWLGAFLIIAVLFGGFGGFGFGGGNAAIDVGAAINNQTIQQALGTIQLSSANNNYETARLIDNQTMFMTNQNNTNLLSAINGFNAVNQNIASGFNSVNQNIADLGYKMESCCCSIKTMLLENRLQDTQQALADARNQAVNAEQSAYLLSQMGKWVANAPATAAYTTAKA